MRKRFIALGCAAAMTFSMASTAFAAVSVATTTEPKTVEVTSKGSAGEDATFLDASGNVITDQVVVEVTVIPYEKVLEYDYKETTWGADEPELAERMNAHTAKVKDFNDAAEVLNDTLAAFFNKEAAEITEEDLANTKILTGNGFGEAESLYEQLGVKDYAEFQKLLAEKATWVSATEINAYILSTKEKVTVFDDEYLKAEVEMPELEATYPDKDTFVGTIISKGAKDKTTTEIYTIAGSFEDGILHVNLPIVDGNFVDMYLL